MLKDVQVKKHDHSEGQSGRPSVAGDNLGEFPQNSCTVPHEIITGYARIGYHTFCAKWVPKMLTGAYKMQGMALALIFLRVIPQGGQQSHCLSKR
jgi:hypothetical protein